MTRRKILFYLIFLWLHTGTGLGIYAQSYNLKSYVERVRTSNLDIKLTLGNIRLAREETKGTKSALLPDVGINASLQRDFNKNYLFINDPEGGQVKFRTNFNHSLGGVARLTQTLFDASVFAGLRMVKLNEELSILESIDSEENIATEAASLYWRAVITSESVDVFSKNLELAQDQFNQVDKLYKKGLASKLQHTQVERQYIQSKLPLEEAKHSYKQLLRTLKQLANLPQADTLILTDKLETLQLKTALENHNNPLSGNTQVKLLEKTLEVAVQNVNVHSTYWYPKLGLTAAYQYNDQSNTLKFGSNRNKLFFGQVGLDIPLFTGFRNKANLAKAYIRADMAKQNLEKIKADLSIDLQQAKQDYNFAFQNIHLQTKMIEMSQQEIEIFRSRLNQGEITPTEFKESRIQLTQNRLNLLNAFLDLHIASSKIKRLTLTNS